MILLDLFFLTDRVHGTRHCPIDPLEGPEVSIFDQEISSAVREDTDDKMRAIDAKPGY